MRPSLEERDVLISLECPPGTSLERMDEITAQAVEELQAVPGVDNVGAHVGRAVQSDQIVNVNASEVWVNIGASANYDDTIAAIEGVAGGLPDASTDVVTYSEQRVAEVLGTPSDEIVVRVYGDDPEILQDKSEEVQGVIAGIDGVDEAEVQLTAQEPTIEVEADVARAERYGISPGDVRRSSATLLSGLVVGNLFEQQKVFDVVVWGAPELRDTESDVSSLLIDTPRGGLVPLGEVADVRTVDNPSVIRHESVQTYVDVTASVSDRGVGDVADDVDAALAQVEFPLEHHAELLGGFADEQAARSRVIAVAVAALIGVFLLLQAAFASWRLAIVAFLTLPVALAGGALAALIGGGDITLGTLAGFIAVLTLAVRFNVNLVKRVPVPGAATG